MLQGEKRTVVATHFVLEISVTRVDQVEIEAGYGSTKQPTRVQREEVDLAEYTVTETELQAALSKGAKLLELTGE